MPKDSYGVYKYILSIVSILGVLTLTGISTSVFRSVSLGFDGALQEGFWKNLRWSIVMFIGSFAVSAYYFFSHNDTLAIGILIGGCLTPFLTSANLSSSFLLAKKNFRTQSIYFDIIENLIPVSALIITIFLTHNPAIIAAVYFISNTAITLYIYRRVIHTYHPDSAQKDPHMLTYGKHLSAMGILAGIASNVDQILLFHFTGPVQLAIYNFATAIPDQAKGPLKTLDQMIQVQFARRSDREIRRDMGNKLLWLAVISVAGVILYIYLAPYIYKIFFPKYLDAVFYTQLYALSYLGTIFTPAVSYLTAKKKIRQQYIINISVSVLRIAGLLAGVLFGGFLGFMVALVLIRFLGIFGYYIMYALQKDEVTV